MDSGMGGGGGIDGRKKQSNDGEASNNVIEIFSPNDAIKQIIL